jgi:Rieske 2Fe-2S family protein
VLSERNVGHLGFDMDARSEMRADFNARKPGHTLPRRFYVDPAYYALDLENIWRRQWLFAGHDCEIPKAGDFFTLQVGDHPIIVVRGRDGAIRAFHNTCRHRGSRICSTEKGSAARLVCPITIGATNSTDVSSSRGTWGLISIARAMD